jgi:phospholipase C
LRPVLTWNRFGSSGGILRSVDRQDEARQSTSVTTRRQFLLGSASAVAALSGSSRAAPVAVAGPRGLPEPRSSGIDHIVVVIMENRSFDHLLGWLPGADGKQAGLTYRDRLGRRQSTYPLAPDFQGCGHPDPNHYYYGSRVAFNGGRCDGWLRALPNDIYAIGYYRRQDLPFLGQAAPAWTVCDRYFAAILGPTFPNRIYLHCGRTDRVKDSFLFSSLPTIWDRLLARGISARYYKSNFSFLLGWGTKYARITKPFTTFLRDCRTGRLPQVSYVDPKYTLPRLGYGNDDHPPADIRAGESFLDQVYEAVTTSPAWPRTLMVITFDEWGGFFEHVPPTRGPDVAARYEQRGFRVPTILVSPFARRGHVNHTLFDHGSVLRTIEWRFGLEPLAPRDRYANNLATALDFSRRDVHAPQFAVPQFASPRC